MWYLHSGHIPSFSVVSSCTRLPNIAIVVAHHLEAIYIEGCDQDDPPVGGVKATSLQGVIAIGCL